MCTWQGLLNEVNAVAVKCPLPCPLVHVWFCNGVLINHTERAASHGSKKLGTVECPGLSCCRAAWRWTASRWNVLEDPL